jgi:hypothetical protein
MKTPQTNHETSTPDLPRAYRHWRLSDRSLREARDCVRSGVSVRETAKLYAIPHQVLRYHLAVRFPECLPAPGWRERWILGLYARGCTARDCAQTLGCAESTVRLTLLAAGQQPRPKGRGQRRAA